MKALDPAFVPFDNEISANILFLKVNGQITAASATLGFLQLRRDTDREEHSRRTPASSRRSVTGGQALSMRLSSAWSPALVQHAGLFLERQGIESVRSIRADLDRPSRPVYARDESSAAGPRRTSRRWQRSTTPSSETQSPYREVDRSPEMRATYRRGWAGTHELQLGMFLQPSMHRKDTIEYANDGFALEELVLRDPANAAAGTIPFHRRVYAAAKAVTAEGHFSDNAVYVQDVWRPSPRVTINYGRARRPDRSNRRSLRHSACRTASRSAPRIGFNYMVTSDQRNSVRLSFIRLHDSAAVNHLSAGGAGTQGSGGQTVAFVRPL